MKTILLCLVLFRLISFAAHSGEIRNESLIPLPQVDSISIKEVLFDHDNLYIISNIMDTSMQNVYGQIVRKNINGHEFFPALSDDKILYIHRASIEVGNIKLIAQTGVKDSLLPAIYTIDTHGSVIESQKTAFAEGAINKKISFIGASKDGGIILGDHIQAGLDENYSWKMYVKLFDKDMNFVSNSLFFERKGLMKDYDFNYITPNDSGGYFALTSELYSGRQFIYYNRMDNAGKMIKYFNTPFGNQAESKTCNYIDKTHDNNVIMSITEFRTAFSIEGKANNVIRKVDYNFKTIWEHYQNGALVLTIRDILEKDNGNILVVGDYLGTTPWQPTDHMFYLAEYDSGGEKLYHKIWGESTVNKLCQIVKTGKDIYTVVGFQGDTEFDNIYIAELNEALSCEEQVPEENKISFVNPVQHNSPLKLNIYSKNSGKAKIYIYDLIGNIRVYYVHKRLSAGENNLAIPAPLSPGAYFIYAFLPDGILRDKLIVE